MLYIFYCNIYNKVILFFVNKIFNSWGFFSILNNNFILVLYKYVFYIDKVVYVIKI